MNTIGVILVISFVFSALSAVDAYSVVGYTRGGPWQHGFMCGCKQWSNDINESNNNNNNGRNGSFFYVAGYLIEERRR